MATIIASIHLIARSFMTIMEFPPDAHDVDLRDPLHQRPLQLRPPRRRYSNLGYITLGVLIGKVTGRHYGEFPRLWDRMTLEGAFLALVFAVGAVSFVQTQATPASRVAPAVSHTQRAPQAVSARRELGGKYCATCHNHRRRTGGLSLENADVERLAGSTDPWEKVLHTLRTNQVPPGCRGPIERRSMRLPPRWSERSMRPAAANPNPGHVGVHRMNGTEDANAVRDLLALEIDAKALAAGRGTPPAEEAAL